MDLTLAFLAKKKYFLWLARIYVKIGQVEQCLDNLFQAISEIIGESKTKVIL